MSINSLYFGSTHDCVCIPSNASFEDICDNTNPSSLVLQKRKRFTALLYTQKKKGGKKGKRFTYIVKSQRAPRPMVVQNNWLHDRSQFNETFIATHEHWVE